MTLDLEIQNDTNVSGVPDSTDLRRWVSHVLQDKPAEITLRIVDKDDSALINKQFRNKNGPTNVLSFPYEIEEDDTLHGDILICAPIVLEEAQEIGIPVLSHWAHLTVHACYHLLGYDHQRKKDADIMESLEIESLSQLGFDNPYALIEDLED